MLTTSKCKYFQSSDFSSSFTQGASGGWYWVLFRGTSGQSSEVTLSDSQGLSFTKMKVILSFVNAIVLSFIDRRDGLGGLLIPISPLNCN